ncbi:hypothetical protein [Paraglaciecola hydrolytica]|uniref:Uncharacterized protein n=1 Tax=Paraglaciecola hydrolytica TaxID=1799789 RepID=A0A148KNN5_9ALTE|nr:hypothetical protein [Paraglaciecola hydrolytica]KXI27900.1 hypothetical protein AX660_20545 [Paraglaciecola hydrolytica]
MKNLTLDHALTPPQLKQLNQTLLELLANDSPDENEFLRLVTLRDDIIQSYLQECDEEMRKSFAQAELQVNGALVAYANTLFKASLKELSSLIRGRKAVKKYI